MLTLPHSTPISANFCIVIYGLTWNILKICNMHVHMTNPLLSKAIYIAMYMHNVENFQNFYYTGDIIEDSM